MTKMGSLSASIAAAVLLAGCVASGRPDYPVACMAEVNPPGAYGYPDGIVAPTVVPETGGTQAGADAVNACIRAKAAAAGHQSAPPAKPRSTVVETQSVATKGALRTPTAAPPLNRNAKPIPAATTPTPQAPRACSYTMVGGTGYICDQSPMRRRN